MNALLGDPEHIGRFFNAEAAVETQLDHAGLPLVHCGECCERILECDELGVPRRSRDALVKGDSKCVATSFAGHSGASRLNKNPAHDSGTNAEEMRPVFPTYARDIDQTEVSFVHQSSSLQGVFPRL